MQECQLRAKIECREDLSAKGLEVVFVSSDKDEGQFEGYFKEMPWLALDYKDRELKESASLHKRPFKNKDTCVLIPMLSSCCSKQEQLSKQFKVGGIPSLAPELQCAARMAHAWHIMHIRCAESHVHNAVCR